MTTTSYGVDEVRSDPRGLSCLGAWHRDDMYWDHMELGYWDTLYCTSVEGHSVEHCT